MAWVQQAMALRRVLIMGTHAYLFLVSFQAWRSAAFLLLPECSLCFSVIVAAYLASSSLQDLAASFLDCTYLSHCLILLGHHGNMLNKRKGEDVFSSIMF